MKPTTFLFVLAATAVSVAAAGYAVVTESQRGAPAAAPGGPLFGELLAQANEVRTVTVESAKGKLTIAHGESGWVLTEKDDYPVAADKVRKLVAGLGGLRLLEAKTDRPERLARLDLQIDAVERRGVLVAVAIDHLLEPHPAADRQGRRRLGAELDRLAHHLVEPREGAAHTVQLLPGADHLAHRRQHARGEDGGGDERADRHVAGDDRAGADIDDQQRREMLQDLTGAGHQAAEIAGAIAGPGALRELLLEAALHLRL